MVHTHPRRWFSEVASLTPSSLQKMCHDRFDVILCLDEYVFTVDGEIRLSWLPDPSDVYGVSDDEGHTAPCSEDAVLLA